MIQHSVRKNGAVVSRSLENLEFDNRFVRELPADIHDINARRQVYESCYSRVDPTPVAAPKLVACAREVCELLGLEHQACQSDSFAGVFSGNRQLAGMDPFAMCYGGHQFGNWAGQLGDGRAINLGEVLNDAGEHWTLQLKGAGPTPYSRTADGLAVLRSSVREFLCSEAMFHLGVPTTRALSLVLTGEEVLRDMFYDGNPRHEPGAVVCRVAPSFVRFGNFQIFAARQDLRTLQRLTDFTIRHDFPHLEGTQASVYADWFREVCRLTADMVVHWMRVGFVHGVMNTDNMSILGLTIDYGPYGWLEDYDPDWTPNTTDAQGRRYRFGNQPAVAHWNLLQLANSIVTLTDDPQPLEEALGFYAEYFEQQSNSMLAAKLGLRELMPADETLRTELFEILQLAETDMTIFYRRLADVPCDPEVTDEARFSPLLDAYYHPEEVEPGSEARTRISNWLRDRAARVRGEQISAADRRERMNAVNPKFVLRNFMAQLAIDQAEQGEYSLIRELLEVLRHPYDEQPEYDEHAQKRPDWARSRAGCSMLSCSS